MDGHGWGGAAGGVHPVADATAAITAALDSVSNCPLYGLDAGRAGELLAGVVALEARLAGLRLRLVSAAESARTAEAAGAPSTAFWLRANTRTNRVTAGRAVKLAKGLDGEFTLTAEALSAGRVSEEQARVIVRAMQALPSGMDTATLREAEAHLVEHAGVFDPVELARLGRHILEVVAPDEAARLLGEQLAREEAWANRRHLSLLPDPSGGLPVTGRLDPETAALLGAALEPLATPRTADQDGPDPRTRGERHADALASCADDSWPGCRTPPTAVSPTRWWSPSVRPTCAPGWARRCCPPGTRCPRLRPGGWPSTATDHAGRARRGGSTAGRGPGPPVVHRCPAPGAGVARRRRVRLPRL